MEYPENDEPTGVTSELNQPGTAHADTLTFKRSHLYAALLPLAFVTGLSLGYLFWGRAPVPAAVAASASAAENQAAAPEAPQSPQAAEAPTRYDVPVDDDPSLGPADAPITIIEFSDFECTYCRKWHTEVLVPLMEANPGKIRYVYRDFPLGSIHFNATAAAEAANCAGDQDKYWEFADLLFNEGVGADQFPQYAERLELDAAVFEECVSSRKYEAEVEADYQFAAQFGIRSTPTFFINGLALVGAQPQDVFQNIIDQELAGEIP